MMRYALGWFAIAATVLALACLAIVVTALHVYTEGQQTGRGLIVECPSVDQVRPTSDVFLTPRLEAPIRIAPPIGGLRFTKPGQQIGSTKCGTHYRAVQMQEIRQGYSIQTWVELAPVGHGRGTSKPIGWSYWGKRIANESINFRRF